MLTIGLPFLTTLEYDDSYTLQFLRDMFKADSEEGLRFLENPLLLDPDRVTTSADFYLLYLNGQGAELSRAIESMKWVQDGVEPFVDLSEPMFYTSSNREAEALHYMASLQIRSPEALLSMARRPWLQESLGPREHWAISSIRDLAYESPQGAAMIAAMPFLDTFDERDRLILEPLWNLTREDPGELESILSHPELTGGVSDDRRGWVILLLLRGENPAAAELLEMLPWISDGISESEEGSVLLLTEMALGANDLFRAITSRRWLEDGLTSDELKVADGLWQLAREEFRGPTGRKYSGGEDAIRILNMPFLDTVDGVDAAAVAVMPRLFWQEGENYLEQVLSHPRLQGGLEDNHAFTVAAMHVVVRQSPHLIQVLLDRHLDNVENRVLELPHSGEVVISVIDLNAEDSLALDILEESLRRQEHFMGTAFPTTYAGLLIADATLRGGGGGPGGILTVGSSRRENRHIIAHELAHTYWPFSPLWIAEGAAEFMSKISADAQFPSNQCDLVENISELDRLYQQAILDPDLEEQIYFAGCEYALGRGLFVELYDSLGDANFREGFLRLYLTLRDKALDAQCSGIEKGVCYVRAAFVDHLPAEPASVAGPIIDRWYYGRPF